MAGPWLLDPFAREAWIRRSDDNFMLLLLLWGAATKRIWVKTMKGMEIILVTEKTVEAGFSGHKG